MDVAELSTVAELLQRSESTEAQRLKQAQAGTEAGQAGTESLSQVRGTPFSLMTSSPTSPAPRMHALALCTPMPSVHTSIG